MADKLMNKYVREYIEKWRMKTPLQKWQTIYDTGAFFSAWIGLTTYTTLKNSWYSYSSAVVSFFYFFTTSYTIWYYFERGEYLRGLQGTCAVGIVYSCLIMQVNSLGPERFQVNSLIKSGQYIYFNKYQSPKLNLVHEQMVVTLITNIVTVELMMLLAFGMCGLNTIYLIIFEGARTTFLGTELPFVDKDSEIGFWINFLVQSVLAAVGLLGCLLIEFGAALICNTASSVPLLLHVDLEELESEMHSNGFTPMAKTILRNVFMKIQDYETVVKGSVDLNYYRLFFGPYIFTYSIGVAIFSQLILNSSNGYGLAVANYFLLLSCCNLGEISKRRKSEIIAELYNMAWYELPNNGQKQVWKAIQMIQNGTVMTIGPFSEFDMETATNLTRSIYRFTMLMLKTFK